MKPTPPPPSRRALGAVSLQPGVRWRRFSGEVDLGVGAAFAGIAAALLLAVVSESRETAHG